ncbi:hypothetical protein GBO14_17760 [Pseudoalteromonas shioyasakiensis]|uniref:hypothetical protein n=1 Tax=Pseudoalteromonas TaxID=53246 RepID=UPI000B3CFDDE|nr:MULTISPECIES: hypothetical protein [Pseudoalteromonas]MCO6356569.1 hypothetical protein [Pseudoalteromonas shioyasakiensis]MDA8940358.1 hypothetical protein [Pseudoalteromonas marina]OUS71495.1 hypothetical protein B5G52_11145 [Pseudoalteromonas sp. A601]
MSEIDIVAPSKGIKNQDVLSSAALTGIIMFVLLTWSKTLTDESLLSNYLSEQVLSFIAGALSYILTWLLSLIRYELKLRDYKRKFTKKINFINLLIKDTTCDESTKELLTIKKNLTIKAAKAIAEDKT